MAGPPADRNLLFGILALQMDFITRDDLIAAMGLWVMAKHRPLGEILVERGNLDPGDRAALEPMIERHLAKHKGNPAVSLAALSSVGEIVSAVRRSIADPEVLDSLSAMTRNPAADPFATRALTMSESTPADSRYLKLREHAKGGLGVVYVARDRELDREVALKEIQDRHADHNQHQAKFLLEAQITGGLEHPGIVPVYGLGNYADGRPFYVMRFIKGNSLADAIKRHHASESLAGSPSEGQTALQKLLLRFLDVCNAVAYAHSRGVLHRDLKPGNIMVGKYGETLVVDWGLAKLVGRDDRATLDEQSLVPSSGSGIAATLAGTSIGTPAYMPPEQATGRTEEQGPRSDVYSLGATLYHLLTGHAPFEGTGDLGEILRRVQSGDFPRPRVIAPRVSKSLEAICLKAMALHPSERYATPLDLASDIERSLVDEPVSALAEPLNERIARWSRRHRTWVQAGAAAFVLITCVAVYSAFEVGAALRRERSERRKADELGLREQAERRKADELRLDAQRQATRMTFDRGQDLAIANDVSGLHWLSRAFAMVPPEDADLRQMIGRNLSAWAARSSILQTIVRHPGPEGIDRIVYGADGRNFLTVSDGEIRRWDSNSGASLGLVSTLKARGNFALNGDGTVVATWNQPNSIVKLFSTDDGRPIGKSMLHPTEVGNVSFSPDGKFLLTGCSDYIARIWDTATGDLVGDPLVHESRPVAVFRHNSTNIEFWTALTSDGKTAVTASARSLLFWDLSTRKMVGPPLPLPSKTGIIAYHAQSAIVAAEGFPGKQMRLWSSKTLQPLGEPITVPEPMTFAIFSPDGSVLLTGHHDGTARLWEMPGGHPIQGPMAHPTSLISGAFSPDGLKIATGGARTTARDSHGEARVWEARSLRSSAEILLDHDKVKSGSAFFILGFEPSPDGRNILAFAPLKTARLFDASDGQPLSPTLDCPGQVEDLAYRKDSSKIFMGFSVDHDVIRPDKTRVIDGSKSTGAIALFNVASQKFEYAIMDLPRPVTAVALSQDGKLALVGMGTEIGRTGCEIQLREAATGKPIRTLTSEASKISAMAFSPDGGLLMAAGWDGRVYLWEYPSGKPVKTGPPPTESIMTAAFSPDGKYLATGGYNRVVRLWDVAAARFTGKPMNHLSIIRALAFSPDGSLLLTSTLGNSTQLWDLASGKKIGPALKPLGWSNKVAFSPEGKSMLGLVGGKVIRWPNPEVMTLEPAEAPDWATRMTGLALEEDGTVKKLDSEAYRAAGDSHP